MKDLRVGYFAYRGWAFELLEGLERSLDLVGVVRYDEEEIDFTRFENVQEIDPKDRAALVQLVKEKQLDVALFYGWSWIVPKKLTDAIDCLCLHPSLLPKYRGGCPIQHQILNNETEGGLTIFRMNEVLDGGDILAQRTFSLEGTLADIFGRIVEQGAEATNKLMQDYQRDAVVYHPQKNLEDYPAFPRRKPAESELKFDQFKKMSSRDFYNFVRALDDPYPNCFSALQDGQQLHIKQVRLTSTQSKNATLFDGTSTSITNKTSIALKDGYAELVRSEVCAPRGLV